MAIKASAAFDTKMREAIRDNTVTEQELDDLMDTAAADVVKSASPQALADLYRKDRFETLPYAQDPARAKDNVDFRLQRAVVTASLTKSVIAVKNALSRDPFAKALFDVAAIKLVDVGDGMYISVPYKDTSAGEVGSESHTARAIEALLKERGIVCDGVIGAFYSTK